ncbi:MAG TPA: redoxin domain-containing protein [Blastocatellia bacterium]|nr:redoxin domain-containing protein [Blastocatellia bacterium]
MKPFLFVVVLWGLIAGNALNVHSGAVRQSQDKGAQVSGTPMTIGETLRIRSKWLGEEREVYVYMPWSYSGSRNRYPVIYTLDGEGTGPIAASAVRFMTGYSAIPQMPEALVVAITNTNRNRDMPIPESYGKGGEENFLAFLADELIPLIEQRYRTQPLRILIGHSQGGTFAHYALTARPKVFQWYLPMDAPLFRNAHLILEKARTLITKDPNYRGRLVTIENLYGWKNEWASLVGAAPKGFYGEQVEIKDETHETMAYKGIYEGLKRLFHDYAPNIVRDNKRTYTLPVLDARYKSLSEAYGYPVDIPKALLLMSATRNVAMQSGAEAVKLVKRAVALYGESPTTKRIMANAEEAVRKGRDPRFEEWANLPPPSVDQITPFLGAWTERKQDGFSSVITFEVRDGMVRAEYTGNPPGGEQFQLEVNFVRVEGQTLQWGVRNGRGPGVEVHTAKLVNGDRLEGIVEEVGFLKQRPPHPFKYERNVSDKKPVRNRFDEAGNLTRISLSVPQRPRPWDRVKEVAIGAAAPDWRLKTAAGETIALSELHGKVVVLDFWAEWCGPCRKLEPLIDQLVREYQNKPVKFFTVSIWPGRDFDPRAHLKEHKMASTFLVGTEAVANDYGIWGVPTYYVIDATGSVSYIHVLLSVDSKSLGRKLREAIEQALSKEQGAQALFGRGHQKADALRR